MIILLGAVSIVTTDHSIKLNAVSLVVTVEGRLSIIRVPMTTEGIRDVPTYPSLTEEHSIQGGAMVILSTVPALLILFAELGTGCVGHIATSSPLHISPILTNTDIDVATAAPTFGETPLSTAGAPASEERNHDDALIMRLCLTCTFRCHCQSSDPRQWCTSPESPYIENH